MSREFPSTRPSRTGDSRVPNPDLRIPGRGLYSRLDALRSAVRLARPQRELRGREDAVPGAADGDPLRPPGDARRRGIVSPPTTHAPARGARLDLASTDVRKPPYDGTCEDLFFYVERLLVARLRRGRRRPAAHRAQPQRHRHDDVPDAAAGVHRWRSSTRRVELRAALHRPGRAPPRHGLRRAHPHAAGAADDGRALPARRHRAARARRARGCARPTRPRTAIRSAPARSPARAFRSIGS